MMACPWPMNWFTYTGSPVKTTAPMTDPNQWYAPPSTTQAMTVTARSM